MKTFLLHAESEADRDALSKVLLNHFENGLFERFKINYIEERDFTRIEISDSVTMGMLKGFISEVPDGHRMAQTLVTGVDESEYDWQQALFNAD